MDIFEMYAEILEYPTDINKISECISNLGIDKLVDLKEYNLHRLQEVYVEIFDFNEKTALFLFQHIAETTEEKSKIILAMGELLSEYEIRKTPNAQPDYLPDVLKAFSVISETNDPECALEYLADMLFETTCKIKEELKFSDNIYSEIIKHLKNDLAPFTSKQEATYV